MICRVSLLLIMTLTSTHGHLMGPPKHGYVPQADKAKYGFEDIWDPALRPQHFSGSWYGDQLVYKKPNGDLIAHDFTNQTEKVLISSTNLEGVSLYYPNSDLSLILLVTEWKQVWRHSHTAVYHVVVVETGAKAPVANGDRLQYCRWAPVGDSMVYIHGNNMYYQAGWLVTPLQVTMDGVPGNIFNGIPDWMYEEDVLTTAVGHYWSPDAQLIIFGKYNDTLVPRQKFKIYGDKSDVYGQIEEIAYPKAGDVRADDKAGPITDATLYLVSVTDITTIHDIPVPASLKDQDHYYTRVGWLNKSYALITWTNRVQNESVVQACHFKGISVSCYNHFEYEISGGWIDSPWPRAIPVTSDSTHYVITHPRPVGDSGTWVHLALMELKDKTLSVPDFLTNGMKEVLAISAYDSANNHLYYLGTGGEPTKRHLYRLNLDDHAAGSECLSCGLVAGCEYVSASFSASADWFTLSCLGPDVPSYAVHSTRSKQVLSMEDNQALKDALAKKLMPTREFMNYTIGKYITQAEIFKPADFDGNKKYPLLIFVYAGPGSQFVMQSYELGSAQRGWLSYMRSTHDVIVASVDGRGTAARGEKFKHEMYRRLGTIEVEDQITFAKYLKENLHYIDNNKEVAIFGWSYGGQTTSHVLAESEGIINCAIAVAPVITQTFYDTAYIERYMGLATKADNEAGYNGTDVLHKAAKYKDRKYLIAHGTADDNVHFMNAAHFINELVKQEVQFTQLMYVDENHSIGTQTHNRHLFRALTNFLVHTCWDGNAPYEPPVSAASTVHSLTTGTSLIIAITIIKNYFNL